MSAFVIVVVPGTVLAPTTLVDNPKLNLLGSPTITVTGATTALSDFSTTAATVTGQPLVWNATTGKWEPAGAGGVVRQYLQTMSGATSVAVGASGAVPQPGVGDNSKFLRGDGTWQPAPVDVSNLLYSADNFF